MMKVLDFGLAKAFQPDASDVSASMSPTISLTTAATQMGMVIGTAAYMAPDHAQDRSSPPDHVNTSSRNRDKRFDTSGLSRNRSGAFARSSWLMYFA